MVSVQVSVHNVRISEMDICVYLTTLSRYKGCCDTQQKNST